jgi:hypothetical protein
MSIRTTYTCFLVVVVLSLLYTTSPLAGQTSSGSIQGTVVDPKEAVIPGARVTLINTATNETRSAASNGAGLYTFSLLMPATYRLEVEAEGFKKFVRDGIKLNVGSAVGLDTRLEIGQTSDAVTITSEAPMLESENASLGHLVSNTAIVNLPTNGRNSYGFAVLVPGVRAGRGFTQVSVGLYNEQFVSINGARQYQSNFQMDGGTNSNPAFNGPTLSPSVDMVEEYKVQTNNFSAEFSNSAGGIVNLVTKSGTNSYHGSLFEFFRNDKLVANNFFNNRAGLPRGQFRYNQFGLTLGGPLSIPRIYEGRNRTFFFFTYEGLRWVQNVVSSGTVPTLLQRNGDFSQTRNAAGGLTTVYDPFSTRPDPDRPGRFLRMPFPGNIVPVSRMDGVSRNLIPYIPAPNTPGNPITGASNFIDSSSAPINKDLFSGRLDHSITQNQKIFGRYTQNETLFGRPTGFGNWTPTGAITRGNELDPSKQGVISYTSVFSPTLVMEASASYVRYNLDRHGNALDFNPVQLGMPSYLNTIPLRPCFPQIGVSGMGFTASVNEILEAGVRLVGSCGFLKDAYDTQSNVVNVTKNLGAHQLKFGGNIATSNLHTLRGAGANGIYNFDSGFTQGPDPLVGSTTAGVPFASFLLGTGNGGSIATGAPGQSVNFKAYGLYLQEDWKASRKLTLNLGVRYDYYTPWTERYNRISNIDYNAASPLQVPGLSLRGGVTFPGVAGNPRGQYDPDKRNLVPRFGIAYTLNPKTVFRGGYGIFTAPPSGDGFNGAIPTAGFSARTNWVPTLDGVTPNATLSNPFPDGLIFTTGSSRGLATLLGQDVTGIDRSRKNAYGQQWNVNLQRTLPGDFVLDAAYAGSRGVHLYANINYNQLPNSDLALGDAIRQTVPNPFFGLIQSGPLAGSTVSRGQLLRPYPQFSNFTSVSASYGSSTYHSLQLKVERRFRKGLSLLGSYTYSKLIDDVTTITPFPGDVSSGAIQDFNNRRNERSLSIFDTPHNLAISGVYELPFGAKKAFLSGNRLARIVASGWQLNGIATFRDGVPLSLSTSSNNLFNFGGAQRPNWNGTDFSVPGRIQDRLNRYFNPASFSQPAPFTFGNVARTLGSLRGPGVSNIDLSLFRNIALHEGVKLQFRAEAFNLLNRVEFGLPNTTIGSSAAGTISSQVNQPRDIQLALKLLF